jgi:2-hydroxy-3-oxopropionate reductase
MGKSIVHIGEAPGAGQIAKACNQIVVGVTIMAVSEALTLARKAGVDVAKVREALLGGFAQSRILDVHGQRIVDRNFAPGFRVRLHEKDLGIAQGHQDLDHSAVARFVEGLAGLGA